MSLSKVEKKQIVEKYGKSAKNSGSVEAQIALLTADINKLATHFKGHEKDNHSRQGLLRKVNLRRKLLSYLKKVNLEGYRTLIGELGIRG